MVLVPKSKVSLNKNAFSCFLKVTILSNWRIVFGKVLYKWGAQYLKLLLVKPGLGILFSTSFNVSLLLHKFMGDGSRSSSISFKYNGSLLCTALWAFRQTLYLIPAIFDKTCKSMQTGVILSLENFWKPTFILAALLINLWRQLRMILGWT